MTIITQLTDNFQKLWIAIRLSVTCTFVAGALVFSATVQAQSADSQQADSMSDLEEGIEELVVTGTLIRGTPIDGANSVTVIDRSELEVQGTPSVIDIVRNLGIASGNLGETNQFQANGAEGVASVNIRGLGNERTLLLLNGRRLPYVGYGFANFSNLNAIPAIALQRLEVLKEGAAATYGSDAVAGVANVITRSKFSGFEISANLNMIDGSDGDTQLGLIWGNEYSPDSNIMISFGLYERSELPTVERDWAASGPATGGTGTNTPAIGTSGIPNPGLFYTFTAASLLNPAGPSPVLPSDPGCVDPSINPLYAVEDARFTGAGLNLCRFRFAAFDNLIEDESHSQFFAELNHSFSDTSKLHVDVLAADGDVPDWKTSPSYPPQALFGAVQLVFPDHPGLADINSQTQVSVDDAGTPGDDSDDTFAGFLQGVVDGADPAVFLGRLYGASGVNGGQGESGARTHKTNRLNAVLDFKVSNFDMSIGLTSGDAEGYILANDASIHRTALAFRGLGGPSCPVTVNADGQAVTTAAVGTGAAAVASGTVLFDAITAPSAFGAASDTTNNPFFAGNTTATQSSASTVLTDFRTATGNDCLYYNPFSNAIPGTALYNADVSNALALENWLIQSLETTRETTNLQLDYQLSGSLGQMGGGEALFAAGVQIRENTFKLTPNALADLTINPCPNPGDTSCTAPTGLFSFLAGSTPLDVSQDVTALFFEAALPIADNLDLQAALRYEDYDIADSLDYKLSALWKPSDALSFRASLGTTFRGASPSQSDANSRVTVLSFVGPTGAFKATDWTGNPNLEPESAAITNLGVVWQPSESFQLTVDYWDIAFTDPVVIEDFNQLISYYQGQQAAAVAANPDGDGADGIAGTADDVDNSADRIAALEAALPDDIENQIICQGGVTCASSANSGSGIERIIVNWVNGASVDTSGLDIALRYSFDIGSGSMTLGATYNTIQSYDVGTYTKSGVQIAEGFDALGFLNQSRPALPLPELRSRYFLDFQSGDHTFVYYINVIGEYQDERLDNELTDGTIAANLGALLNEYAIIDEHITHDAHYNLGFGAGKGTFTASLINLTDEAPPGAALDLVYDPFTHNPIGRQIKLGIRYHVF